MEKLEIAMSNNLAKIKTLFFPLKKGDRVVVTHVKPLSNKFTPLNASVYTGQLANATYIFRPGDTGVITSTIRKTGSYDCKFDKGHQYFVNKSLLGKLPKCRH